MTSVKPSTRKWKVRTWSSAYRSPRNSIYLKLSSIALPRTTAMCRMAALRPRLLMPAIIFPEQDLAPAGTAMNNMKILFFGDIMGKPGRQAVAKILPMLKREYAPDFVIANVENLAHGKGVTLATMRNLAEAGVDFFTSGNHIYDKPEYKEVFAEFGDRLVRPANFAPAFIGDGYKIVEIKGEPVLIANLLGEVFMEKQVDQVPLTSPFYKINEILGKVGSAAKIKILDFHADATSEKRAMGFWVDGRMSAVVGTHTHVPTADAQILPQGTGYVTDLGMTGAAHSVIGVATADM